MKTKLNVFLAPYSNLTPADLASGKNEVTNGLFYHADDTHQPSNVDARIMLKRESIRSLQGVAA